MMKYDKLVRDQIPDIIRAKGTEPKVRLATQAEYEAKLKEKLKEEVAEYLEAGSPEELADIMEVVHALGALTGHEPAHLENIRAKKAAERGAFKERIILEEA
jgi:predicted house-cleaning noncanonical NTP pyrophosphatase (MazG superfamily)